MNIEGLYDMIGYKPEQTDKFEEARFRRAMEANENRVRNNKELFEEHDKCFTKCVRYNPCPICNKCQNKASHLYVKCQICEIPICVHKYIDRERMIRRKNFAMQVSKETMDKLQELEQQAHQ